MLWIKDWFDAVNLPLALCAILIILVGLYQLLGYLIEQFGKKDD